MATKFKKRGQKIAKKVSRFSRTARAEGKVHLRENLFGRISHVRDVRLLILEWVLMVVAVLLLAITQHFWYMDSYSVSAFEDGGTYTEATLGKIDSLNPLFASTDSEKTLSKLLFATLAETDYSGHAGIGLASSITSDSSNRTWTVKLRENLKWSDGEPITNEDVLFTIELIRNPNLSTIYSSNLSGVSVKEDEAGNIVFALSAPYADFVSALDFPILPKHILGEVDPTLILESDFSKNPVSSGAFSFNASQTVSTNGETIVYLSANPNYYKGKPELNSFAIHTFLDEEAIATAVNSGAVTATANLSGKAAEKVTSTSVYTRNAAINSGVFAFLNMSSTIFSNKTVRQAVQQGIDTDALREIAHSNSELDYPILSSQTSLTSWPELPAYDPEAAENALAGAGVDTETPISIVTVNDGYLPEVAEAFASQLRELGLKAEVMAYDLTQEFILNVVGSRSYDIFIYEIELGTEPDLFSYYHSSQAKSSGLNFSNYASAIVNDLVLGARSASDPSLKSAKYASFLKYWVSDVPAIALYQSNMVYYYNKNVRTFSEDLKMSVPTDRFTEVNYWAVEKTTLNRTP